MKKINWNPKRVSSIKPLINKSNWKKVIYPSKIDDSKKVEKKSNNCCQCFLLTAINVLLIF